MTDVTKRERRVCTGVLYLPPEEQAAMGAELAHSGAATGTNVIVGALQAIAGHSMMDVQELRASVAKHQLAISDRFHQLDNRVSASLKNDLQARQEIALLRQAVAANNALLAEHARTSKEATAVVHALIARLNRPKPATVWGRASCWLGQPGHTLAAVAVATLAVSLSIVAYAVVRVVMG